MVPYVQLNTERRMWSVGLLSIIVGLLIFGLFLTMLGSSPDLEAEKQVDNEP